MTEIDNGLLQECLCGVSESIYSVINDIPILTCDSCSIPRQLVILSKDQYKDYYLNGYYKKDYTRTYQDELDTAKIRIADYGDFLQGKILDVGCGLGGFVDFLRLKKFNCWGQDITDSSNKDTTYQGELEDINFPTDYFQTVTLHDVLEHIVDPINFLTEIFRLTSQGGHVIIDFPNFFCEEGKKHWRKIQHLWMFDYKQLAHILKNIGFVIVRMTEPIPGKIVYYIKKPKQNRTKILLPPGIGDIYWVLTKMESFLEINKIDLPDILLQEQGVKNRGLAFIEKFPFLHASDYQNFPNGRPSEFSEAYKQDKQTVFRNVLGCDYFLAFNGPMRFDKSLSEIHPEYKVNWYPRMFVDKEEESYGLNAVKIYGEYIVGYFSGHKMYKHWLSEFSTTRISEALAKINKVTGYKILLVGSPWDLEGPSAEIKELIPDICIDLVNQTSLTQLFGLFKQSKGVIGFPSGITIMSVAFKINTVMIWNNFFRKTFWKNACVEESWNIWYKTLNSNNLSSDKLANTYLGMLSENA